MARRKPKIRLRSFGVYDGWNAGSKKLPKIVKVTTDIEAIVDIEFGFIVNIIGAKNQELEFCIDHPGIRDAEGQVRPPFDGTVYVKTNDWDFYLGDTIWLPIADKLGNWKMSVTLGGTIVAAKTFKVSDGGAL